MVEVGGYAHIPASLTDAMPKVDHFKLRFGPYATPRFRYGRTVRCLMRGKVEIVGLSDAPIPWPIGKLGRAKSLVLYGALARAVRRESNQAVARAWGVTGQTVRKWRRALGVQQVNDGTFALKSDMAKHEPWAKRNQRKAWAKARDPARREKIAAARRGKPRPQHVIDAMTAGRLAKPISDETRRKMSASQRKRGAWPPAAGRAWTAAEDALVRKHPAAEVARRTGRSVGAVQWRWRTLGLPDRRKGGRRGKPQSTKGK